MIWIIKIIRNDCRLDIRHYYYNWDLYFHRLKWSRYPKPFTPLFFLKLNRKPNLCPKIKWDIYLGAFILKNERHIAHILMNYVMLMIESYFHVLIEVWIMDIEGNMNPRILVCFSFLISFGRKPPTTTQPNKP